MLFELLPFFLLKGFFCRQCSYVLACFATTMSMATSFYYSYLWIATPCVTLVFCFMTICNNYFFAWFFFFFFLFYFCILMCVFVMLFVGDLQLQPHKHPQSTCFLIFLLVFLTTLSRFAFCFVMFCFVQVCCLLFFKTEVLVWFQPWFLLVCNVIFPFFFQLVFNVYNLLSNLV